jgi:hypothetical protein
LKQRVAALVALGLEFLDELFERQILISIRRDAKVFGAKQQITEGRIAGEIAPQNQGIDEKSDQPFELRPAPIGDGRAHDYIFLSSIPIEQDLEPCEQSHEGRNAMAMTHFVQSACQLFRQRYRYSRAVKTLPGLSRPVGWQI